MIKFFRKIRQKLLTENKFSKYLIYAIGEIILVVIGILIALQLNTAKENKEKSELGYKYLTEMRTEVQSDFFELDGRIRRLNRNIKNHESALRTNNIDALPLDSINMIINPINLDFEISELTFNRMKNLGLTSLSENEDLNSQISEYYNSSVVSLKLGMDFVFEELKKYTDFFKYNQDAIDYSFDHTVEFEFPELYNQSREELINEKRYNSLQFIKSNRGRMIILSDLESKRYSLAILKSFKTITQNLLESIVEQLKNNNSLIEPLPEFPSDADFTEITVKPEILEKYIGTYQSETSTVLTVLVEGNQIYIQGKNRKDEIIPSGENKFFVKDYFLSIMYNKKENEIISFTVNNGGKKIEFFKIE
ncbi:hypothetical protein [Winogradskyella sp. A2]|uniref:hypothetical protein n=1 Tax=Winogradskyella sp. A2 TaxID=3366944 RepID=UPI00398C287B